MHTALLCDGHDAAATHEIHWTELPGTPDEAGRALAVCPDPACTARAMAHVDGHGEHVETVPVGP